MASKNKVIYVLEKGRPIPPPRPPGRHKNVNNDDVLIKRAVEGIKIGKYRSNLQAANALAPESKTLVKVGDWRRSGSHESIVSRLRRAISVARKEEATL